jgi:phosphoglycolate phosphatase-like HAD superfamily hydrolase
MKFADIEAVLFDLDGTLIDSAPDLGAAADKMRTDRGLASLAADLYRPMAGAGARGMLGVAFGMTPDHPDYNAMREEFFVNYERRMTELTYVFDGVTELIAQLHQRGLPWGVVTNKSMRFAAPLTRTMPCLPQPQPWWAVTARPMPNRIRHRCWKPHANWA